MRAAVAVLAAVSLAGCLDGLDFSGPPSMSLTTRDFRVTIMGCSSTGFLGCAPGGTMEAVLDGVTVTVPTYQPRGLDLFPDHELELTVESPMDPDVKLILDGQGVHVEELPWFDLELARTPGQTVSRAASPAHLVFDVFRDADGDAATSGVLTTRCPNIETFDPIPAAAFARGVVAVALDDARYDGDCTHEVRVTQTVNVPNQADIAATSARTVTQTFSSTR